MSDLQREISRRRTFAIISHPDAGKTTLTEKLLLYGGAIQLAGSVKGKAAARHAVSDWMELEKQRGISITSSVLQFEYNDYCINILDTPGHQDFSEDTYRTLMAADSAVMVIDAAKGIEPQTRKLFKVCAMRHIPIFTFINKLDREARSPYDLLEELEKEFGIGTYPMNWPIGCGVDFKGVYDRTKNEVLAYTQFHAGTRAIHATEIGMDDEETLTEMLGERLYSTLRDDVELLDGAGYEFDAELIRSGDLSPVFFGSALMNFGVEQFLSSFLELTTPPLARKSEGVEVEPTDEHFSAFVFKIQANMNKAHRDRIAFMRICSGKFERDAEYFHVQGNKPIRLAQPQQMMAEERQIIDEAYAGDIIGVFDPGIYAIGDTICAKDKRVCFEGIPTFAPEHFAAFERKDTMKRKQFETGIRQIAQEGAIQIFHEPNTGLEEVIVGVVGQLQFDVLEYRLQNEYSTAVRRRGLPYENVRWIVSDTDPSTLTLTRDTKWVQDFKGKDLLLFGGEWNIAYTLKQNPGLELAEFSGADMERNFKLTLCYDGTRYRGWQRQGNTADTIQGKLEKLLGRLLEQNVEIHGSGRTDAGVHAAAQTASFRADTALSCGELLDALRSYLPEDIGAISLEEAPDRFHARLSAREKTYVYRIWNSGAPCVFERKYVYIFPRPLDLDAMKRAGEALCGRHGFAAFSTGRKKGKAAVRTLRSIDVSREGEEVRITYTADGFLYNMARILTGTLLEIGAGERSAEEIPEIFASQKRERAGFTAPAKGLCLLRVEYE